MTLVPQDPPHEEKTTNLGRRFECPTDVLIKEREQPESQGERNTDDRLFVNRTSPTDVRNGAPGTSIEYCTN